MADLVSPSRTYGLVDILDRVLDKGLVVVGDIKINLANVELLTIQIRLLICSIDKAEQIGLVADGSSSQHICNHIPGPLAAQTRRVGTKITGVQSWQLNDPRAAAR